MDISKVLEVLNVDKIDESAQNSIVEHLNAIVESKAEEKATVLAEEKAEALAEEKAVVLAEEKAKELTREIVEPVVEEAKAKLEEEYKAEKAALLEEYDAKYEAVKESIVSDFSNFVDVTLDEELQIPEHIMEYARQGELYGDLVEQFKMRIAVDEGTLDEEARDLLKEARDEIIGLKSRLDESTEQVIDLKSDAQKLAAHVYLRKKCDGLTESKKSKIMKLIGEEADVQKIDERFELLVGELVTEKEDEDPKPEPKGKDKEELPKEEKTCVCPDCGKETTVMDGKCSLHECPECEGVKLTDIKEVKEEEDPEEDPKEDPKKAKKEKEEEVVSEGFDAWKSSYLKTLREGLV